MKITVFFVFAALLFVPVLAQADYVYLKNGDSLSGEILENTNDLVRIKNPLLGEMTIKKAAIKNIETNEEHDARIKSDQQHTPSSSEAAAAPVSGPVSPIVNPWENKISAGYQKTGGNSKNSTAHVGLASHYKNDRNEWQIKGEWDYGSDHGKMNTQKFYGRLQNDTRLAFDHRWFNTRTVEVDHDRFSNIDYRVLPSIGMGYWFREEDYSKFELDLSAGWEYTNYGDETKSTSNPTLIPHLYFDHILTGKLKFAEDLSYYPSLSHFSNYRLRSESSLVNPISDRLNWKISFVDEFNSNPPTETTKKNDYSLVSSLEYSF